MGIVRNLSIDIETYSDVDLSKCGVYKYVEGDFHILLFAYASISFGEYIIILCSFEVHFYFFVDFFLQF